MERRLEGREARLAKAYAARASVLQATADDLEGIRVPEGGSGNAQGLVAIIRVQAGLLDKAKRAAQDGRNKWGPKSWARDSRVLARELRRTAEHLGLTGCTNL